MLCKVLSRSSPADGIYDLRLAAQLSNITPGQFVHVQIPGLFLRRPISICGYASETLRLVFAVKGEGTRRMALLRERETVDLLGPLGNGFPMQESDAPVLLVGGGIGLPPLLHFAKTYDGETHAVAGFRNAGAVILQDEFPSAEICTDDGSTGYHGYPHERLEELLSARTYSRVLCCGPQRLLSESARVCREAGVPCFVSLEERMGCGVGACLVCACSVAGHYRHVCKDGPVFPAGEVDWA